MQLQVGNLRDFVRFLRACALRTSQLVNRAELARDVGVSPATAGQWLSTLEQSGIITLLEPWFSSATQLLVKTPKLRFNDSGLCAFLMGMLSLDDLHSSPLAGALWETAVFTEIRKHLSVAGTWQLAYWRDRTKEADFHRNQIRHEERMEGNCRADRPPGHSLRRSAGGIFVLPS